MKENRRKQMDNLLNNKNYLEGLQEIRQINAEFQRDEDEDEDDLSRTLNPDEIVNGKDSQRKRAPTELPPIKRPNSVKKRPRKAPVVV